MVEVLLILCDDRTQFAKLQGRSLNTSDGEAIKDEAAEVLGRVKYFINRTLDYERPTI